MLPTISTETITDLYTEIRQTMAARGEDTGTLCDTEAVSGGDINLSFRLKTDSTNYFLKLNKRDQLPTFHAEADGLSAISNTQTITCPAPLHWGEWREYSYLLLQFIPLKSDGNWRKAGQQLAVMHQQNTGQRYGFPRDSYCGPTLQNNHWQENWAVFFVEQRIRPLLITLAQDTESRINEHCEKVHFSLQNHQPKPALVHGDLWSGNIGFSGDSPILYDPAIYIGDRETDLAMTQLFGGFPQEFYRGYNAQYPIAADYEARRPVYQLYHLLNHANLFGSGYYQQVETCLSEISRRI